MIATPSFHIDKTNCEKDEEETNLLINEANQIIDNELKKDEDQIKGKKKKKKKSQLKRMHDLQEDKKTNEKKK